MVERQVDGKTVILCGKDKPSSPAFPWEKPGVCLLLLLATVWGKPALEAQGPRLTSDCSRCK